MRNREEYLKFLTDKREIAIDLDGRAAKNLTE